MPQPYRGKGELVSAAGIHIAIPSIGTHFAEICTLWAQSEELWAQALAVMLGQQMVAGLSVYNALIGSGAQRSPAQHNVEVADRHAQFV